MQYSDDGEMYKQTFLKSLMHHIFSMIFQKNKYIYIAQL